MRCLDLDKRIVVNIDQQTKFQLQTACLINNTSYSKVIRGFINEYIKNTIRDDAI